MNLHENYRYLKHEAYAAIRQKRHSGLWIAMLEATPIFLGSRERSNLLLGVNAGMRILDDIADGDRKPPEGSSRVEYLEQKQSFIRNPQNPSDQLDYLFQYCYQIADNIGIEIQDELDAFFRYFLFDAKRLGTGNVYTRAQLDEAYDACDIDGTIRGALKVFGDDAEKAPLLFPLGRAVRKFYSLRDYEDDITAGFVNIPLKEILVRGITPENLPNRFSPPVRDWFLDEASTGLELLQEHRGIMADNSFQWRGRVALPFAYEKPAKAYFNAVLSGEK